MCEQEQNRGNGESEGAAEFAMPDCCGPMMAQMMKVFRPASAGKGAAEAETGGAGASRCCESMMARMREACSESSNGEGDESSSDERGAGCRS